LSLDGLAAEDLQQHQMFVLKFVEMEKGSIASQLIVMTETQSMEMDVATLALKK
jgi:hypothetical protein